MLAALSVLGADINQPPAKRAHKLVGEIYGRIHGNWLVKYRPPSKADPLVDLFKMLFAELLKGLGHRRRRQKIAAILASQLDHKMVSSIITGLPDPRSAEKIDADMCDIISDTIRQLSIEGCLVFLYKVFAGLSEGEIARRTGLKLDTVKAHSRKSMKILQELVTKEARMNRELLAVLREASRRAGVAI